MRALWKLTWVETKLFVREPLALVFSFAFPLLMLFVLAEVFGNEPTMEDGKPVWRGVGPTDYYVPAYVGLVIASTSIIWLPTHIATYRESGVLRRFRASLVPARVVIGSQVLVTLALGALGGLLLTLVAAVAYGTRAPDSLAGSLAAFTFCSLAMATFGVLMGAVLSTARAAQGAGILLFFAMMFISGAGPPPEVFSDSMRIFSDLLPLTYVIRMLDGPWLGIGWDWEASIVVAGIGAVSTALSLRFFRWE
jgi:ABC-2 type transport system permease protein